MRLCCPNQNCPIDVPDDFVGARVRCPHCGAVVVVDSRNRNEPTGLQAAEPVVAAEPFLPLETRLRQTRWAGIALGGMAVLMLVNLGMVVVCLWLETVFEEFAQRRNPLLLPAISAGIIVAALAIAFAAYNLRRLQRAFFIRLGAFASMGVALLTFLLICLLPDVDRFDQPTIIYVTWSCLAMLIVQSALAAEACRAALTAASIIERHQPFAGD